MPRMESVTFRLGGFSGGVAALEAGAGRFADGTYARFAVNRGKDIDLSAEIEAVWMEAGELCLKAKAQPSGAVISPYLAYAGILGVDAESLRSESLAKSDFVLEAGRPGSSSAEAETPFGRKAMLAAADRDEKPGYGEDM
jgi:hypothetical protein